MTATTLADLSQAARVALQNRRYPADVLAQIDLLTADELLADPWIALLQGRRLCRVHSRFETATPLIDHALAVFRERGDADGELWASAEWVVMRYHEDDYATGMAGIEPLLNRPMRPYLRAELYFGQFLCLTGSFLFAAAVAAGETALALLESEHDPWLQRIGRIQMLRNIAAGYHYTGQTRRSVAAAEEALALALERDDTADMRPWCYYELGTAYWRQGRLPEATRALDMARRQAESWGHDQLWRWAVAGQGHVLRDQDRLDAALAAYQLAECWAEDPEGPVFIQIRQSRLAEARWTCEASLTLAENGLGRYSVLDAQTMLALIELASGAPEEALRMLDDVCQRYLEIGYNYQFASAQLYRAAAALALGRTDIVGDGMRQYLGFAAREEVLTCAWWIPEIIESLLLYAAQHGIESSWAQFMLARRFPRGVTAWFASNLQHRNAELEIARRVQISLLPEVPPTMPDLDIAAIVIPAIDVGGDFVAYFPQGAMPQVGVQRQLGVAVGDISGKGLSASLLLSGTVVALNTVAANSSTPSQVAEALHLAMEPYTSRSQMNIALCYALLAQHQGGWSLRAVGAGAVPPLIRRASGTVEWLETSGFPLGTIAQRYHEAATQLGAGDIVVLLSDGIVEAMNADRQLFGFERLAELVGSTGDADSHAIMSDVLEAVYRHSPGDQHDDMTIVVIRVLSGASHPATAA